MTTDSVTDQVTEETNPEELYRETSEENTESTEGEPEPKDEPKEESEVVEEYVPNFAYRANQEDKEFPENVKPYITNKESEEYFRTLFAKADGVEPLKEKYNSTKERFTEVEGKYNELHPKWEKVEKGMKQLKEYSQNNLDVFLNLWEIPEEKILEYASKRLEASPEEKDRMDSYNQQFIQTQNLQDSLSNQRAQQINLMQENHNIQMQQVLNDPEVSSFHQTYDGLAGKGEFLKEINAEGDKYYRENNKYLSPREAIIAAMDRVKQRPFFNQQSQPAQQIQQPTQSVTKPATIPNVGGGTNISPAKRTIRSISDIEKAYDQKYGD